MGREVESARVCMREWKEQSDRGEWRGGEQGWYHARGNSSFAVHELICPCDTTSPAPQNCCGLSWDCCSPFL
eukprot:759122-Hanusia_phi.AAC.2